MKKYFCKYISLIFAGALIISFSSAAIAQQQETPDSVRYKTLGCLYRAIQSLNDRNVRFKALQEELEEMHPLQPENMDSLHFAENLIKVSKYLIFLESHRNQITRNTRIFSDSIQKFQTLVSSGEEKKSLADFLAAYKEESSAFIGYSQRLSLMLTDIRAALFFLQTVPIIHKGKDVEFNTDKSANEKYMDFEGKISAGQMQIDKAIDRMIKLTEKENKAIQGSVNLFSK
jgi:hypothetical protein